MRLSFTIKETCKRLSSLPILMQESFWCWQCSDRYIISLHPPHTPTPFPPALVCLMVSVEVKYHVYLLTCPEECDTLTGQLTSSLRLSFDWCEGLCHKTVYITVVSWSMTQDTVHNCSARVYDTRQCIQLWYEGLWHKIVVTTIVRGSMTQDSVYNWCEGLWHKIMYTTGARVYDTRQCIQLVRGSMTQDCVYN